MAKAPVTNPFITAVSMFTILPSPDVGIVSRERAGRVIACLPWVGLLLGLIAGGVTWLIQQITTNTLLSAVCGLAILALCTGFMHLDGLADTADGLGSRKPAEEALTIMKRSDIGPMGVSAMVLVLGLDAGALAGANHTAWQQMGLVIIAPLVSRLIVLVATRKGAETARPGGFGALVADLTSWSTIVTHTLIGLAATMCLAWLTGGFAVIYAVRIGVSTLAAWIVGFFWQRHLIARFHGSTGDTFGSLIEITQMTFLLSAALCW